MTNAKCEQLVTLKDGAESLAQLTSDMRGRQVIDNNGRNLGSVHALLVDENKNLIRFLEVESGKILGRGPQKSFIPVDAITKVTKHEVHINQEIGNVANAPIYEPALTDHAKFFEDTYGHYRTVLTQRALFAPALGDSIRQSVHPCELTIAAPQKDRRTGSDDVRKRLTHRRKG